jgi:ubiquinone/menaquinone biosynthesis C-methylase UbiE
MHVTAAPPGPLIPVERRSEILGGGRAGSGWRRIKLAGSGARLGAQRTLQRIGWAPRAEPELELIRFGSSRGETLVGLVDSWNFQPGAPMVIIPPAWAKTKETLLPLARTIVSTFRRANQPIAVLRLDGIRRRGESYRDPQYRSPGSECLGMTFSQGAEDIRSAIRFASENSKFQADKIVLITFSGASIEARKVLAETEFVNLAGWISVVGAADLHSGLRVLSGGQDYIGGYERGVRFGRQRVLGIDTDADLVCEDALSNGLAHLEDARRQMAKISTPITWLQGRDDAWIDPEKVQEVLSCGDSSARRLIEVPTGHQLRTSHEALDVFQLIASEVGRFTTGNPLRPAPPDLADLTSRRLAERSRLPKSAVDLAAFWHDYVLGEGELPGMELLTGTTVYREMMDVQVNELRLRGTERVADLGSGTGTLTHTLASGTIDAKQIQVDEYDFLVDALRYSRQRIEGQSTSPTTRYINCDLSFKSRGQRIPASDESYDAAAMSLLINYVSDPRSLLREVHRILRIGGRIVLAALRPDTDISKIYVDSADEVRRRRGAGEFPNISHDALNAALASCLNEAARLVDLEEQGFFHFWEPDELAMMAREAGFEDIRLRSSFGQPPQAIIVSGMVGSK